MAGQREGTVGGEAGVAEGIGLLGLHLIQLKGAQEESEAWIGLDSPGSKSCEAVPFTQPVLFLHLQNGQQRPPHRAQGRAGEAGALEPRPSTVGAAFTCGHWRGQGLRSTRLGATLSKSAPEGEVVQGSGPLVLSPPSQGWSPALSLRRRGEHRLPGGRTYLLFLLWQGPSKAGPGRGSRWDRGI